MTKSIAVLALVAVVVGLCSPGLAQDIPLPIILANSDNPVGNNANGYTLGGGLVGTLTTGGKGLGGGDLAATSQAISSNGKCVFVVDDGTDDVASFAAPSYGLVGKSGFPGMFSAFGAGGSVAVTPNGKCLYTGNSGTENVSAWRVNASCSITHIADYVPSLGPDLFSPIAVTPDGGKLIVPAPDFEAAELFKVNANCTLTDVNNINWANVPQCGVGCFPTGMDITNDSKVVIFGNASSHPSALSASIGLGGLSNPGFWDLTNLAGLQNDNVPWFSKPGAAGTGQIYFGMTGPPSGEVTANFTESPLSITVTGSTPIPAPAVGAIRTVGNMMVIAEFPNQIQTAQITGSTLVLGPVTIDPSAVNLRSLEVFPKSR